VVLQHESTAALPSASGGAERLLAPLSAGERAQIGGPLATAFGYTFMWALVMALLAIVAAVALLRAERASRVLTAEADDGGSSAYPRRVRARVAAPRPE
jgi:hypothetical protein